MYETTTNAKYIFAQYFAESVERTQVDGNELTQITNRNKSRRNKTSRLRERKFLMPKRAPSIIIIEHKFGNVPNVIHTVSELSTRYTSLLRAHTHTHATSHRTAIFSPQRGFNFIPCLALVIHLSSNGAYCSPKTQIKSN